MTPWKYHSADKPQPQWYKHVYKTHAVTNACVQRAQWYVLPARTRQICKILASLHQWQEGLRTYLRDNNSSLPFQVGGGQEVSSTTGHSWESSKVISYFIRAASNNELSPALLIQGTRIFVTTTGSHIRVLQTPENVKCIYSADIHELGFAEVKNDSINLKTFSASLWREISFLG